MPGARRASGGAWGSSGQPPRASRGVRKALIMEHYKFHISLKITILNHDYVTEKFFEGFLTDSVMVYLGSPNEQHYAPAQHSFISFFNLESQAGIVGDSKGLGCHLLWRALNRKKLVICN
jgi:hypothetical protein